MCYGKHARYYPCQSLGRGERSDMNCVAGGTSRPDMLSKGLGVRQCERRAARHPGGLDTEPRRGRRVAKRRSPDAVEPVTECLVIGLMNAAKGEPVRTTRLHYAYTCKLTRFRSHGCAQVVRRPGVRSTVRK
jgi:hypothetical protein